MGDNYVSDLFGSTQLYNFSTGMYEDKPTWESTIGNAAAPPTERASEGAYNEFTMKNLTDFFTNTVSAAKAIYTAKAAVDISRVQAQTGLNVAKTAGIYPKAGGLAYDSSTTVALIGVGTVGLVLFLALRK